jgi:alpha-beta hydrolase superfamily lysophospholipase
MSRSFLLIHGMCCTGDVWRNFRTYYEARDIRVFTPTLRPTDRVRRKPPRTLGALRFAHYVDDLEREIDQIEQATGNAVTVIGHSMGGLLAQALAERNRPNAAVLISPTAPAGVRTSLMTGFWAGFAVAHRLGIVPSALYPHRVITDWLVFNQVPKPDRRGEHRSMVHESLEAFADFRVHHVDETKIRIPLLTIAATRDRLVPAPLVRLTAKKYAAIGGDFLEYENHGHWLYAEPGWEQPAADILAWVESNTRRAASAPARSAVVAGP